MYENLFIGQKNRKTMMFFRNNGIGQEITIKTNTAKFLWRYL